MTEFMSIEPTSALSLFLSFMSPKCCVVINVVIAVTHTHTHRGSLCCKKELNYPC